MGVWTKKRGSMNAVVLMATPCDDGEEVSRVRLREKGGFY